MIRKIVQTNSIELDEVTATTIPKRVKDRIKKVPVIPETCENKLDTGHKSRPRPTVLKDLKSPIPPSVDKSKLVEAESGSGAENTENESDKTPRWKKKLVDTSSGIWQTSASKLTSSKANVSNKLTSVVQLAKKVTITFQWVEWSKVSSYHPAQTGPKVAPVPSQTC